MSIFGRLKEASDAYQVDEWWRSLTEKQRADIFLREKKDEVPKTKVWTDVWILYGDLSKSIVQRKEVYIWQGETAIRIEPVEDWKFTAHKAGFVTAIMLAPDGWNGLATGIDINSSVIKGDYVEVKP